MAGLESQEPRSGESPPDRPGWAERPHMNGVVHVCDSILLELRLLSKCGRWYTESTKAVNPISSNTACWF